MKMAKPTQKDIDAAGNAMAMLIDISSGYYPARDGDEEDGTYFFDPDKFEHLRSLYDLIEATLDAAPGWPVRIIGGMCFVVMFDKNQIIDPNSDTLQLHPRFSEVKKQRDELLELLKEMVRDFGVDGHGAEFEDGECLLIDRARAAIAKATGDAP
jgi:hypothetical protein